MLCIRSYLTRSQVSGGVGPLTTSIVMICSRLLPSALALCFASRASSQLSPRVSGSLLLWVGILAVAVGSLAIGDEMRANFGVFLTFRDGLITRQRNYDCFQPF